MRTFRRWKYVTVIACLLATAGLLAWSGMVQAEDATPEWSLNATAIESCSCPMFCTCYFSDHPAAHHHEGGTEHFCRFNMAYKVNSGHYGDVDLTGAKFWIAGDLGDHYGDGETDWSVVTFDPAVSEGQRAGIAAALGHVFPVKWKSFSIGEDAEIEWDATPQRAVGRLGGGKAAEVVLTNQVLRNSDEPVVIHNLKYWAAPRNDGFVLMPNEVNAYRLGDKAFETRGTNGFMITIDISSADVAQAAPAAAPAADDAHGHGHGDGHGHSEGDR
jgi:hypothetical protein